MIFIFSFGKLSPTNTVLTPLAPTRVPPTSSWNASMSTIMKPPVVNMSLALFWLIWSQEPWIQSDQVRNILRIIQAWNYYNDLKVPEKPKLKYLGFTYRRAKFFNILPL